MNSDQAQGPSVSRYSEADLPTEYGMFRIIVYREVETGVEHCAMVRGQVASTMRSRA